jgi:hypothetical protein
MTGAIWSIIVFRWTLSLSNLSIKLTYQPFGNFILAQEGVAITQDTMLDDLDFEDTRIVNLIR